MKAGRSNTEAMRSGFSKQSGYHTTAPARVLYGHTVTSIHRDATAWSVQRRRSLSTVGGTHS